MSCFLINDAPEPHGYKGKSINFRHHLRTSTFIIVDCRQVAKNFNRHFWNPEPSSLSGITTELLDDLFSDLSQILPKTKYVGLKVAPGNEYYVAEVIETKKSEIGNSWSMNQLINLLFMVSGLWLRAHCSRLSWLMDHDTGGLLGLGAQGRGPTQVRRAPWLPWLPWPWALSHQPWTINH